MIKLVASDLDGTIIGRDNNICVACCGNSLIAYQVKLLLDLGVKEIIVGFDKDFESREDEKFAKEGLSVKEHRERMNRVDAENGATAGKFDLAKRAKALNLDAIHDTVHEMARDEARHGKAFEGLLARYFK